MDKRLKVLHIITDSNIGGAGRLLCYLSDASDKTKYEYSVLLPQGSALRTELEKRGIKVTEIPGLTASHSPKAEKALTAAIISEKPDIVHTHACLSGQLAARKAGIKHRIMTKHCSTLPPVYLRHFPGKMLCRIYFKGINRCIATDDSAETAMRVCGMPKRKLSVVYNGSPELEKADEASVSVLRQELNIPANRITVGYFGRLEAQKGPEILLQAASLCLRFTKDLHFVFCGEGSQRQELESLAGRYGLEGNVSFTGFVPDIAAYMSLCHIIASPSLGVETSSLSLCEGMSLGLIPVVTDVGGSRELIGDCGICVRPDDPAEFYTAIMKLARDPDLMKLYSRKARERYRERCTAARMAAETCRIYDEVAQINPGC